MMNNGRIGQCSTMPCVRPHDSLLPPQPTVHPSTPFLVAIPHHGPSPHPVFAANSKTKQNGQHNNFAMEAPTEQPTTTMASGDCGRCAAGDQCNNPTLDLTRHRCPGCEQPMHAVCGFVDETQDVSTSSWCPSCHSQRKSPPPAENWTECCGLHEQCALSLLMKVPSLGLLLLLHASLQSQLFDLLWCLLLAHLGLIC